MLDESDLILAALNDESKLRGKVESVMSTRLKTVDVKTPLEQVMPLLDAGYVPIVVDGDAFVGLLTRMDVLNHLRRRLLR
jgi:cystathionine beta-synthase